MTYLQELKLPTDFASPEDWRSYVRQTVPPEEVDFTLALGRTRLFFDFYGVRKQPFPEVFASELRRIEQLSDPERTRTLSSLNDRIFVDMTRFLFEAVPKSDPEPTQSNAELAATSRSAVPDLIRYLGKNNLYFAFWMVYREREDRGEEILPWPEHLQTEIGVAAEDEREFALLMGQTGKLLYFFRDHGLALPPFHFEQLVVLHHLSGAERNLQTKALVQGMVEVIGSCGSA